MNSEDIFELDIHSCTDCPMVMANVILRTDGYWVAISNLASPRIFELKVNAEMWIQDCERVKAILDEITHIPPEMHQMAYELLYSHLDVFVRTGMLEKFDLSAFEIAIRSGQVPLMEQLRLRSRLNSYDRMLT